MDIDGLEALLRGLESGDIKVVAKDLPTPSPLAAEILTARPYAFLDDAPLEERRTNAVAPAPLAGSGDRRRHGQARSGGHLPRCARRPGPTPPTPTNCTTR